VNTSSPTLALKASSCETAGEKVLDSMAMPAMAIRGFSFLLLLQDTATIISNTGKTNTICLIVN